MIEKIMLAHRAVIEPRRIIETREIWGINSAPTVEQK